MLLIMWYEFYIAVTPKFECDRIQIAKLHAADVKIRCVVKADPPVDDFKVYWAKKGQNLTMIDSETMDDRHSEASIENTVRYLVSWSSLAMHAL